MHRLRKVGLAAVLAVAVVAGSAFGGGLLSAGAATNPTAPTAPSQTQPAAPPDNNAPMPGHHCRHMGQGQNGQSQGSSQSDPGQASPTQS